MSREDNGHVALRSEISHTDAHSRPEVVQSRISWLLAQKFAVAKTPLNLIGKLKAIVPIAGGQTTGMHNILILLVRRICIRVVNLCMGAIISSKNHAYGLKNLRFDETTWVKMSKPSVDRK